MPRVGLSPATVVDHALELIDEQGPDGLTLASVAARAGVATPSLYKHVAGGLAELRRMIAVRVTEELTARLAEATRDRHSDRALEALVTAYVGYAEHYPRRYAALPQAPREEDPELVRAAAEMVRVILAVLAEYGLADSEAIHAARTVRSVAHGFASLCTAGAFQLAEDTGVTRQRLIATLEAGLRAWPHGPSA